MEGQGVTNYQTGKSSYGFSATTTEFDDALIQRGIITREQALFSKGASSEEAVQLTQQLKNSTSTTRWQPADDEIERSSGNADSDNDADDDDDDNLLDDEFLDRYRQQRLEELQEEKSRKKGEHEFGEVVLISRDEWNRHVNEDSMKHWVVVCLTSSDTERTGRVEQAVRQLAEAYRSTKFILIPSRSAIPNWPDSNLPSIFLYRYGKMQTELLRLSPETDEEQLEDTLRESGVL
jgi:hypothetical protein